MKHELRRIAHAFIILFILLAAFLPITACHKESTPTLDAFYVPASLPKSQAMIVANRLSLAQTFSVANDAMLVRVDLPIKFMERYRPTAPLKLDIRRVNGLTPTEDDSGSNVLATVSVSLSNVSTELSWVSFNFSPVAVKAGERLAIALTSTTSLEYEWAGDFNWPFLNEPPGTYPNGQAFDRGASAARSPGDFTTRSQWGNIYLTNSGRDRGGGSDVDLGFKTYVIPPLPLWPIPLVVAIFIVFSFVLWRLKTKFPLRPARTSDHSQR